MLWLYRWVHRIVQADNGVFLVETCPGRLVRCRAGGQAGARQLFILLPVGGPARALGSAVRGRVTLQTLPYLQGTLNYKITFYYLHNAGPLR